MGPNDDFADGEWVDEKMSMLDPSPEWQPDAANGLVTLRTQRLHAPRGGPWKWAVAAATVVCLCLPAFSVTRTFASRCVDACVGMTSRVGQLFRPAMRTENASRAVTASGARPLAPNFTLDDATGDRLRLSALQGSLVLVNFWATWCAPCQAEIPWFAEFQTKYRDRGLTVVGISLDEDGWRAVRPFAEQRKINYRLAIGNDELLAAYSGLGALPATFLIDRHGRIAAAHVGLVAKDDYENEIVRLLAEK